MPDESMKRRIAYKMKVGDLLAGKVIMDGERFSFLELGNRQIIRVNVVANIVDKFSSDEKKYTSFTLDDASGQIRAKVFGEDVDKFAEIGVGTTVMIIGVLRSFNNELYISPEIIKIQDTRYLLVRKLELEKEMPKSTLENKEQIVVLRDMIIEMIKTAEDDGGIEADRLIMDLKQHPDLINQEIKKLLEGGIIYEPRPGVFRWLG